VSDLLLIDRVCNEFIMREQMVEEIERLSEENARLRRELAETKRLLESIREHVPIGIIVADIPDVGISMESKFRTIDLELANDSIIVRDLEDRILYWNAGAVACYGWTREEVIGKVSHTLLRTQFPEPFERIRDVISRKNRWMGELTHFRSDGSKIVVESRWSHLKDEYGCLKATLEINTDITSRKMMERQLEEKSNRLQEVNAALKVLLKHRDEDRKDFEEALLTNIDNLVLPYLKRIKNSPLSNSQSVLIELAESHLRELTSEFGKTLALQYRMLTPTEIRIAALVREGKTSKEIADILCISEKTASFHRNNIRTKLGLRGTVVNLRSHLLSLA
jgi:PAS domain S-box-containing protein